MPSIIVQIEWDHPDDKYWLNKHNLKLVLSEYCPNTAFEVTDIENHNKQTTEEATE